MFAKTRLLATAACATLLASPALAQDATIVQPGGVGQDAREIDANDAISIVADRYIQADVDFMQNMIWHHFQAVEMGRLVDGRTATDDIVEIARKIQVSQADEIAFMQSWLRERGQDVPDPAAAQGHAHHMMHASDGGPVMMKGMATPEQMEQLASLSGTEFDRMYLQLMIAHHAGALDMVDMLNDAPGAAYDPILSRFVNDVVADQSAEITVMSNLLADVATDPRTGLAAGFRDAEQAAKGLRLVRSLPKPAGFFDPENPAGLRLPAVLEDPVERSPIDGGAAADSDEADPRSEALRKLNEAMAAVSAIGAEPDEDMPANARPSQTNPRFPLLSFGNTDMAFSRDLLIAGNYHGFNIYRLSDEGMPNLISSVVCPGGQGDVSIAGDLLIMSVEDNRGRTDCGLGGVSEDVSPDRFRGLRIFDISDIDRPRQVGQVQTCRGSHTHSIVADDANSLLVYNSGISRVRDEEELAGCTIGFGGEESALFSIDVIEIPKADPSQARIIDSPRIFAKDGRIAGLWRGGDHGPGTQDTATTDQCHDITIFPAKNIAAGACSGNGIVLDISDPRKPVRVDDVTDKGFAYWHSATFNNDGTKVLFTDEWGGGARPRCRSQDPMTWGADAIYDIVDGKLVQRSLFKIPSAQSETENCVAHNGSLVPVPGRDIFVQAWYQGGISLIDFTDSSNPVEIGYFDRGPIDEDQSLVGGFWSVYYFDGKIYGTEIVRGLDVLELVPTEMLTENEIAAAKLADQGEFFNPQQQMPVTWPDDPVVALAYLDQYERDEAGEAQMPMVTELRTLLARAQDGDASVADQLETAADGMTESDVRGQRMAGVLRGIAANLRNGG